MLSPMLGLSSRHHCSNSYAPVKIHETGNCNRLGLPLDSNYPSPALQG